MTLIYKICESAMWREAERLGVFTGAEIDIQDGYIHFSTAAQVAETARKHFRDREDLVLVAIDSETLDIRWEQCAAAICSRISTPICRQKRRSASPPCILMRAVCRCLKAAFRSGEPSGQLVLQNSRYLLRSRLVSSTSLMLALSVLHSS